MFKFDIQCQTANRCRGGARMQVLTRELRITFDEPFKKIKPNESTTRLKRHCWNYQRGRWQCSRKRVLSEITDTANSRAKHAEKPLIYISFGIFFFQHRVVDTGPLVRIDNVKITNHLQVKNGSHTGHMGAREFFRDPYRVRYWG